MSNPDIIRIATRKSPLALVQANEVARLITAQHPHITCEIISMSTTGDNFLGQPLSEIGGKGLFTKELEEALLAGTADIAVHSMKDVATQLPDALEISCVLPREDVRDALICSTVSSIAELPLGASFGTSSLRRAAQLLHMRPDLKIVPLRGNVQTRLDKIAGGVAVATMLAQAGLNRLGLRDIPAYVIPHTECLPAVAQGAIGIESRKNDSRIHKLLAPLNCDNTMRAVLCERAFLRVLDGSCRTPIAGLATITGDLLRFDGLIASMDGASCHRTAIDGMAIDAESLGKEAGKSLLGKG